MINLIDRSGVHYIYLFLKEGREILKITNYFCHAGAAQ